MLDARVPLLTVKDLQSWYGESHILHGVNFDVHQGEVVTLLGRNGAGKTTTMKSIMGIVGHRTGSIRYEGTETIGLQSEKIARLGIAFCPEERGIFASLGVEENLLLPPKVREGGLSLERIFELFPNLKERLGSSQGTKLSGGEQQMLAIGRALMARPKMILMDEPSMGLSPLLVKEVFAIIKEINRDLGVTILLVEQNARAALSVASHGYIMEQGKVVLDGSADELRDNEDVKEFYLGGAGDQRKSFKNLKSFKRRKRWL